MEELPKVQNDHQSVSNQGSVRFLHGRSLVTRALTPSTSLSSTRLKGLFCLQSLGL